MNLKSTWKPEVGQRVRWVGHAATPGGKDPELIIREVMPPGMHMTLAGPYYVYEPLCMLSRPEDSEIILAAVASVLALAE